MLTKYFIQIRRIRVGEFERYMDRTSIMFALVWSLHISSSDRRRRDWVGLILLEAYWVGLLRAMRITRLTSEKLLLLCALVLLVLKVLKWFCAIWMIRVVLTIIIVSLLARTWWFTLILRIKLLLCNCSVVRLS